MEITLDTAIVINDCYGGFRLSDKAALLLAARKGIVLKRDNHFLYADNHRIMEDLVARNDPDLIDVVSTLGEAANGECAKLRIRRVKITVHIADHDGREFLDTCSLYDYP